MKEPDAADRVIAAAIEQGWVSIDGVDADGEIVYRKLRQPTGEEMRAIIEAEEGPDD